MVSIATSERKVTVQISGPARLVHFLQSIDFFLASRIGVLNGFCDIILVPWKVTSRGHRQPQQLDAPRGLARRRRGSLGHTNSLHVIDEDRQRFRRKTFRRHLRQRTFDVNETSVACRRSGKRDPHLLACARDSSPVQCGSRHEHRLRRSLGWPYSWLP